MEGKKLKCPIRSGDFSFVASHTNPRRLALEIVWLTVSSDCVQRELRYLSVKDFSFVKNGVYKMINYLDKGSREVQKGRDYDLHLKVRVLQGRLVKFHVHEKLMRALNPALLLIHGLCIQRAYEQLNLTHPSLD
jgi:hypothetical protein